MLSSLRRLDRQHGLPRFRYVVDSLLIYQFHDSVNLIIDISDLGRVDLGVMCEWTKSLLDRRTRR